MSQEKMVTILGNKSDILKVSRLAKLAEGNVEKFRELYRERFQSYPYIYNANDSRLTQFDSGHLVTIN